MTSKINIYSYLSYFMLAIFIFFILFFPSIVNAATLTPRSSINNFHDNNRFDYTAVTADDERPQENWTFFGTIGSTYSRKLYGLRAYFNTSLTANHTYRITINTNLNNFNSAGFNYSNAYVCFGSSWTGANSNCNSVLGLSSISSNSVSFNFRSTSNYNYFQFRVGPQTNVSYSLTNTYSFNITSFVLDDLSSVPTSPSNSDVITNDNKNTSDIITNDNRNTSTILGSITENSQNEINISNQNFYETNQNINNAKTDIIDNQNSNTDKIDRDLVNCQERTIKMEPRQSGAYIAGSNGRINENSNYMVSKFYRVDNRQDITINFKNIDGMGYGYLCNYNQDMQLMGSCIRYMDMSNYSKEPFKYSPTGTYITFTYKRGSGAEFTGNICTTSADTTQDIYNYISDDTDPNSSEIVEALDDIGVGTGPISALVTLPITLLDKFEDGISSTCTAFNLGNLLGTNLTLPCIDIPSLIGNNLWTIIDAITSIFMIYNIVMLIITAFDHLTSLSDDFDTLYTPDSVYESRLVKKRGYERHGD